MRSVLCDVRSRALVAVSSCACFGVATLTACMPVRASRPADAALDAMPEDTVRDSAPADAEFVDAPHLDASLVDSGLDARDARDGAALDGPLDGRDAVVVDGLNDTVETSFVDAHVDVAVPPVRALGANTYDILGCYVGWNGLTPADGRRALESLRAAGLGHARFNALGWTAHTLTSGNGWIADREAFLRAFDALVADAAAADIMLIPSLLWSREPFADANGEPLSALLTPGTATRRAADEFVSTIVTRYRASPTILAWEITNEVNLVVDIDVACDQCGDPPSGTPRCGLWSELGQPCRRTEADNLYLCHSCRGAGATATEDVTQWFTSLGRLIHSIDRVHPIASGNTAPHAYQRSRAENRGWVADRASDYEWALERLHPPEIDWVTIHGYVHLDYARPGLVDFEEQVRRAGEFARSHGKGLYVGELGEPQASCPADTSCHPEPTLGRVRSALLQAEAAGAIVSLWHWSLTPAICESSADCLSIRPGDGFAGVAGELAARRVSAHPTLRSPFDMSSSISWTNDGGGETWGMATDEFGTVTEYEASLDAAATSFLLTPIVPISGRRVVFRGVVIVESLDAPALLPDGTPSARIAGLVEARLVLYGDADADLGITDAVPLDYSPERVLIDSGTGVTAVATPRSVGGTWTVGDEVRSVRVRFEVKPRTRLRLYDPLIRSSEVAAAM